MYCSNCGIPLPEDARFCPLCGRKRYEPECATAPAAGPVFSPCDEVPAEDAAPVIPEEVSVFPTEPAPVTEEPAPLPEMPKKRRKPLLLPCLILAGLFVVGLVCYFVFPRPTPQLPEETKPSAQTTKPPLPDKDPTQPTSGSSHDFTPTDADCFLVTDEGIRFLPQQFDGGKILVIPDEIDGVPVTAIAPEGFAGCEGITTIILPNGLETIGKDAFRGCPDLRGIYFPDTLREIGEGAFANCISMEAVSVPAGIESIGTNAFTGCASLMYIFYGGTYEQWLGIYNEYVTPFTYAICQDGDYYHGVKIP